MLATEQILLKDRIRHLLHIKKCTISSLAENETERVRISRQINGDANVTIDTIRLILFSFPSVSADWLILGEGTIHKATTAPTVYNNNSVNNSTAGGNITTGNIANNFNGSHLPSGCSCFQPEPILQPETNFQPERKFQPDCKPSNNAPASHRASIIEHYESMIASLRSDLEKTRLSLQTALSEIEQLKRYNQSSMSILSSVSSSQSQSISSDLPRQPHTRQPRSPKSKSEK